MSNHASSTSLRTAPLSPTSPPNDSVKPVQHQHRVGPTPQTPTSPQLMSASSTNNASNTHPPSAETTSQIHPLSSPPSSEPMSTQVSQKTIVTTTNTFPTPASSTTGAINSASGGDEMDSDRSYLRGQNTQEEGRGPSIEQQELDAMDVDHDEHRRTDHDRQGLSTEGGHAEHEADEKDIVPANRDEEGTAAPKDILQLLHQDIGSAFLLCNSSYPTSGPDPAEDLIAMYGLEELASSVARTDPVTGDKINRLRKSYEGKLRDFNLAGKNKPHKVEDGAPGSLHDLMRVPEDQWQYQSEGKDAGLKAMDSQNKFERAMKMDRGLVTQNEHWEEILGHEKSRPTALATETEKKGRVGPVDRLTSFGNGVSSSSGPEASRPRRANRKRRYDDESFEGYGEGFLDDETAMEGIYSDEDGRPSAKKKRRKESSFTQNTLGERAGSYGVGMYSQ